MAHVCTRATPGADPMHARSNAVSERHAGREEPPEAETRKHREEEERGKEALLMSQAHLPWPVNAPSPHKTSRNAEICSVLKPQTATASRLQ